jgi:hypothetical protein
VAFGHPDKQVVRAAQQTPELASVFLDPVL